MAADITTDRRREPGRREGRADPAGGRLRRPLLLIGEERERPYERPPLSKECPQGKAERETIYVHPAGRYPDQDVDLRLGTWVTGIDPAAYEVRLADGERVRHAEPLLTTGSTRGGCRRRAPTSTECSTCAGSRTASGSRTSFGPRPGWQ